MSTPNEVVGPPAQTAAMTITTQFAPMALAVRCPICDAQPDHPCEDMLGLIRHVGPHFSRIAVAKGAM